MSIEDLGLDKPTVRTFEFELPVRRLRFMFHDGGVIDVLTRCTDSRVNEFAFSAYYGKKSSGSKGGEERIVGHADLGPEEKAS